MPSHLSTFIFSLAAEFEIPLTLGEQAPMTDEAFLAFRDGYLKLSADRDAAVFAYLRQNPTLFRALLPFSPRVFGVAAQVVWYLDELLTRDRVCGLLNSQTDNLEQLKVDVRHTLQILAQFRGPIEAGYLLLYGSPILGDQAKEPPTAIKELVKIPAVHKALEEASYCGFEERLDSKGNKVGVYDVRLDSGGTIGFDFKGIKLGANEQLTSPTIRIGELLPRVTPEDLRKLVTHDPFLIVDNLFAREARNSIGAVEAAKKLNAAVLFDREADSVVLQHGGVTPDEKRQTAVVQVLNVAAPYLRGVPPDRLQELRELVPTAFLDFRATLHGVVVDAMKEGFAATEELKARTDRDILPALRHLDAEVKAEARRGRIVGYGTPLLAVAGSLVGGLVGLDLTGWLGLAAVAAPVKAAADFAAATTKLEQSPFYFLWKSRQ